MPAQMLNARDAARYLGVSRPTLWRLVASGRLPHYEVEGVRGRRYRREDLDKLIREGKAKG